jgi:hypothetical protein
MITGTSIIIDGGWTAKWCVSFYSLYFFYFFQS